MIRHVYCRFLVRHTEYHLVSAAILKTHHFTAYARVTSGALPQCRGHDNREQYFLTVYSVHLLAYNGLYFFGNTLCRR